VAVPFARAGNDLLRAVRALLAWLQTAGMHRGPVFRQVRRGDTITDQRRRLAFGFPEGRWRSAWPSLTSLKRSSICARWRWKCSTSAVLFCRTGDVADDKAGERRVELPVEHHLQLLGRDRRAPPRLRAARLELDQHGHYMKLPACGSVSGDALSWPPLACHSRRPSRRPVKPRPAGSGSRSTPPGVPTTQPAAQLNPNHADQGTDRDQLTRPRAPDIDRTAVPFLSNRATAQSCPLLRM
jgi:hypothetical protein